jgi:hypothetical protein
MVYDDILDILILFTPSLLLVAYICMCVCVATRTDVEAAAANRRLRNASSKYSPAWHYKPLETLETVSEVSGAEEAC